MDARGTRIVGYVNPSTGSVPVCGVNQDPIGQECATAAIDTAFAVGTFFIPIAKGYRFLGFGVSSYGLFRTVSKLDGPACGKNE